MTTERIKDVYALLAREYGIKMSWRELSLIDDVDATDKELALANPNRVALIIVNVSSGTIYLRPSRAASTSAGIVLVPSGGFMSLAYRDDGPLPALSWHAIGSAGNLAYIAFEGVIS